MARLGKDRPTCKGAKEQAKNSRGCGREIERQQCDCPPLRSPSRKLANGMRRQGLEGPTGVKNKTRDGEEVQTDFGGTAYNSHRSSAMRRGAWREGQHR